MASGLGLRSTALLLVFVFPGRAWAGESPQDRCARMAGRLLPERLQVWQQRLKLDDWAISVMTAHRSELRPNTLGNIRWDVDGKIAVIRVLDASDYQMACREALTDMEFTLVHELIHLKLSSLPRSEESRQDEESTVNHLTKALLSLDRRK